MHLMSSEANSRPGWPAAGRCGAIANQAFHAVKRDAGCLSMRRASVLDVVELVGRQHLHGAGREGKKLGSH